jgi:hypothetical protein
VDGAGRHDAVSSDRPRRDSAQHQSIRETAGLVQICEFASLSSLATAPLGSGHRAASPSASQISQTDAATAGGREASSDLYGVIDGDPHRQGDMPMGDRDVSSSSNSVAAYGVSSCVPTS